MALKAKPNNSAAADQCPPGMWPGVCVAIIDLGTHWEQFQGGTPFKVRKVWIVWECEAEEKGKDKRFYLGSEFGIRYDDDGNLSLHTKNGLRQLLESWRNKPYAETDEIDVDAVLGKPCQLNVMHETKTGSGGARTFARIKTVAPLAKGQTPLKPSAPPLNYSADAEDGYPGPAWVPLPFGIKIEDYLGNSLERGGSGKREDLRKKKGPQTPGQAGTSDGPSEPGNDGAGYDQDTEIPF